MQALVKKKLNADELNFKQRCADTSTSVQLIQRHKCSTANACVHMLSEGFQIDWI